MLRRLLVLAALSLSLIQAQENPGALPEIRFDLLSDRTLTTLGKKALGIRTNDWKHAETEHFVYHFFDRPTASAVSVEAEFYYRVIAQELGRDTAQWERKCHLFLFDAEADWKQFQHGGGLDPWTGGIHSGDALFLHRNPGWRAKNQTLPHEITHLVLHRFFGNGIPLWLNEGFAEFAATRCRAAFYRARGFDERPRVKAVIAEQFIPLAELTNAAAYPQGDERVLAFYTESEKLVRFLSAADKEAFGRLLEALAKGARLETALTQCFGRRFSDLAALEREFRPYAISALVPTAQ